MCEATTILMVASLALTAWGTSETMAANKDQAKYTAAVDKNNAISADAQASAAAYAGSIEEENHRAKVRQVQGAQRAQFAAHGVDMSEGTPLDLMVETAATGETDAQMLRFNAMREAWGYREQAGNYRSSAAFGMAAMKSRNRGTLITGMSQMAGTAASGYGSAWGRGSTAAPAMVSTSPRTVGVATGPYM